MSRLFDKYGDHTQPYIPVTYSKEDIAWSIIEDELPFAAYGNYSVYDQMLTKLLEEGETPQTAAEIIINHYYNNQP